MPAQPSPAPGTPAAQKLLAVAWSLFYERGITAVGVATIAEQAGVTKKTIYDRFGSKEGLIVAYLQDRLERYQEHVRDHLASNEVRGTDRALGIFDALASWLGSSTKGCGMINAYAELSGQSSAAEDIVRTEKRWTRELFESILAEEGMPSAPLLARQLGIIHAGAIVERAAGGSPSAITDAQALARALIEANRSPLPTARH